MSEVYSKASKKDLELKRDVVALQQLLQNIQIEEKNSLDNIKNNYKKLHIDFTQSFIMFSQSQVYKSYSIIGLMTAYNRYTKYYILELAFLLDIWYQNSSLVDKSRLLDCDILIIRGVNSSWQAENKKDALIELINIRKSMGKVTWIFIEGATKEQFDTIYPGVSNNVYRTYNSKY